MRRSLLLFLIACSAQASSFSTSATCTFGSVTVSNSNHCLLFSINGPGQVSADAGITNSPGFYAAVVDAGAFPAPYQPWSASAQASLSITFTTAGPVRPGFAGLVIGGFGGFPIATVTQGSTVFGIGTDGPMYGFELGLPFTLYLSVNESWGGPAGTYSGGSSSATAEIGPLLEADGTTQVPFFEIVIPEPRSLRLLLAALVPAACCALLRRRLSRSV